MAQRDNLWAPWRIGYLRNLDARDKGAERGGCFLCEYWRRPEEDAATIINPIIYPKIEANIKILRDNGSNLRYKHSKPINKEKHHQPFHTHFSTRYCGFAQQPHCRYRSK